eukprot:9843555-Alexandrium_andersonii.AAC.1
MCIRDSASSGVRRRRFLVRVRGGGRHPERSAGNCRNLRTNCSTQLPAVFWCVPLFSFCGWFWPTSTLRKAGEYTAHGSGQIPTARCLAGCGTAQTSRASL